MKRPLAHRLFSGFLALLILTASVGLTVLRHTCRQSGHTTASVIFSTPHHGCEPDARVEDDAAPTADAHVKGACCDFKTHQHKLDAPSSGLTWAKNLVPDWVAWDVPTTWWPSWLPATQVVQTQRWHAADSSPPPLAGRALLALVCKLVI